MDIETYDRVRSGGAGFIEMPRGLIAVWGKEAVQFLDGMITNDMKTLADGREMLAAFANAQGRLIAVVRVRREGERFLIETEDATREMVFQNLFRFSLAGDFFVEDLTDGFRYFEVFGSEFDLSLSDVQPKRFSSRGRSSLYCVPTDEADTFFSKLEKAGAAAIDSELYETLRIENGVPRFGADMDETTIVPELGLEGLISYTKGCYIGQEIIARIHYRGHVAKRLTGLVAEMSATRNGLLPGAELKLPDGKNAGRITSVTYSPKLEKTIALGYVRFDHLAAGTRLYADEEPCEVAKLPFIGQNGTVQ